METAQEPPKSIRNHSTVRVDDAKSAIRSAVSRALARALILGIDNCEQEDHELTQLQQIDFATMVVMCYDQAFEAIEGLEAAALLQRLTAQVEAMVSK